MQIGYTLSSEEFGPKELLRVAKKAESAGFSFLMISDHFHPWVDEQGQSPFVWNMIGALSQVTATVKIGIGVNAPIIRYHPAIIAQAAATSQVMLEGRFILGVGTGENLNEHIVGQGWPPIKQRREMLAEAIEIMRQLWQGGYQTYDGQYYFVDAARIYTLPKNSIPIIYSAFGKSSAKAAGELGDGLVSTIPDKKLVNVYRENGGKDKPVYGQMSVCYSTDKEEAKRIVLKQWPLSGIPKPLNTELRLPSYFENTSKIVSIGEATRNIPTGNSPRAILDSIEEYKSAGYDHVYIHNIGPYQTEFIEFAKQKILPEFSSGNK